MASFQSPSVILIKVSCQGNFYWNGKSRTMKAVCGIFAFSFVKGFHIYYSMPWFVVVLLVFYPPLNKQLRVTFSHHCKIFF